MKITVGVPTHNAEHRIAECLESLLAQSHPDLEILVSQNGSSDQTAVICDQYATRHEQLTVFHHTPALCMRDNFRFLLKQATTPLFHWRADDDLSDTNYLASLHNLLAQDKSKKLAGGAVKITRGKTSKPINRCTYPPKTYPQANIRIHEFFVNKMNFNACDWFYGVWDRLYLTQVVDRLWSAYDSETLWGTDALTVLSAVAENSFACTADTTYIKRILEGERFVAKPPARTARLTKRFNLYFACLKAFQTEILGANLSAQEQQGLAKLDVSFSRRTLNINLLKDLRWKWHAIMHRK